MGRPVKAGPFGCGTGYVEIKSGALQPGAATCSKGFVVCFLKFPFLAWAAWQLQYSLWPVELSENMLQSLRNKLLPQSVECGTYTVVELIILCQQNVVY